ncbi:MAG: pterin-binding domain-containing protein [Candidatus Helarchaeales archaeon]
MVQMHEYEIAGVKIGGEQGKNRVVLIGSIFYSGHDVIKDSEKGIFDQARAEEQINNFISCMDEYNTPGMLDIVAEHPDAMVKFIEFIVKHYDGPIIIDGFLDARIRALRYCHEQGLMDRVIYDSIWLNPPDELEVIKETGVKTAIIFSWDSASESCDASRRYLLITQGLKKGKKGLIPIAHELGIKQLLVDNVLTDFKSLANAIETNILVKSTLGYPVGCGPGNIAYYLSRFQRSKTTREVREASLIAVAQMFSDFLLFGPIEHARTAFSTAWIMHDVKEHLKIDFFDAYKVE